VLLTAALLKLLIEKEPKWCNEVTFLGKARAVAFSCELIAMPGTEATIKIFFSLIV
jgi:hypothetical protein